MGWSDYLNKLLNNLFGFQIPEALSKAPWPHTDGDPWTFINLPAVVLVVLCALLLIRGASESALVNTIMVLIKLGVLLLFCLVAFTAFDSNNVTADFAPFGVAGVSLAAGTIFFSYIGLDAVSTAGDEVKDPQRTMPRALIAALLTVTGIYLLVAIAALGTQPWQKFEEQESAGLATILDNVTGSTWAGTLLAAGAVISIFSVTLVTMYGQTRILFAMGRDGMLPSAFAKVNPRSMTPVNNTIIVAIAVSILAAIVPLDYLIDMVSIGTLTAFTVVSLGVIILRVRQPDLARGFRVPLYRVLQGPDGDRQSGWRIAAWAISIPVVALALQAVDWFSWPIVWAWAGLAIAMIVCLWLWGHQPLIPVLSIMACGYILSSLHWYTWAWFGAWVAVVLIFYLLWSRHHSALNDVTNSDIAESEASQ